MFIVRNQHSSISPSGMFCVLDVRNGLRDIRYITGHWYYCFDSNSRSCSICRGSLGH